MKKKSVIVSFVMALLMSVSCFLMGNVQLPEKTNAEDEVVTRTVALERSAIDTQSAFELFDDATLETQENITTFEGTKTFNLMDFCELDLVAMSEADVNAEVQIKYNYN